MPSRAFTSLMFDTLFSYNVTDVGSESSRVASTTTGRFSSISAFGPCFIHAEGYPAGEMKHGPNALIDENLPVVGLATRDDSDPASLTLYEKSVANIKEVKARDGNRVS